MDPVSILYYLITIIYGSISLILCYKLIRKYRFSYLIDYLIFIICTNIWGFLIWLTPRLIGTINYNIKELSLSTEKYIVISIIKWFGFPVNILLVYFITTTIIGILGLKINKNLRKKYFVSAFSLSFVILLLFIYKVKNPSFKYFGIIQLTTSYLFIVFMIGVLGYFLIYIKKNISSSEFSYKFVLLSFSLNIIYFLAAIFPINNLAPVLFYYLSHLIPLFFLYYFLNQETKKVSFQKTDFKKIKELLSAYPLTKREKEITVLLIQGRNNKFIETELFLSLQTVKNYISSIYKKIGVNNRLELTNLINNLVPDTSNK